jgi:hypothetical protein
MDPQQLNQQLQALMRLSQQTVVAQPMDEANDFSQRANANEKIMEQIGAIQNLIAQQTGSKAYAAKRPYADAANRQCSAKCNAKPTAHANAASGRAAPGYSSHTSHGTTSASRPRRRRQRCAVRHGRTFGVIINAQQKKE